jgi:hypothetical protein
MVLLKLLFRKQMEHIAILIQKALLKFNLIFRLILCLKIKETFTVYNKFSFMELIFRLTLILLKLLLQNTIRKAKNNINP